MTVTDPIIVKFREAVNKAYGPRIERVVLYGSRARGDARPGSDYDVAVFLKDMAFIVNVKNRTVVTAIDNEHLKQNVFTNIDSAIVAS